MKSLLPPNATGLERGLEAGLAPLSTVERPIEQLWDPATCAVDLLPWLAWGLSVDSWDADWSETVKRDAVARSIALHRVKGTPASVQAVLARFDDLLEVVEWHQASPRRAPHTFEVVLPIVGSDGKAQGKRTSAAFADQVIREISRTKPLREHFVLVQKIAAEGLVGIQGAARVAGVVRQEHLLALNTSQPWDAFLQTEDGEPLENSDGAFLEHQP